MIISLIGMPGSYKTATGKILAEKLNYCFLDTDDILKDRFDRNISAIFNELGESVFRDEETEALRDCLLLDNTVISCGGGIILNTENRKLIKEGSYSFWMDTAPENTFERASADRPLLKGKNVQDIAVMKSERDAFYGEVGKTKISTDGKSPAALAEEIFAFIEKNLLPGGLE